MELNASGPPKKQNQILLPPKRGQIKIKIIKTVLNSAANCVNSICESRDDKKEMVLGLAQASDNLQPGTFSDGSPDSAD
ncbi:hypothetical protein SLA2020_083980 [Shorea laevis]